MSRKESGMPFVVYSSPKKNEQGENLQYVMPVPGNKVTLDEIDAICAEQSMLRKGELTQAFTAFAEAVRRLLADGKRVETKIGTFMPQLKLRQPMTDAESIDAGDVRLAGIGFEPKKEFVESVRSQTRGFRKFDVPQTADRLHDETFINKAIQQCIEKEGYVTAKLFCYYTGISISTGRRLLESLSTGEDASLTRRMMGTTWVYERK